MTSKRPGEADQLLSDAASPQLRAEREKLAQDFVEERMKPQLLQEFEQNKGRAGEGIGSVGTSSGGGNLQAEFTQQSAGMESLVGENGVKHGGEVGSDVQSRRSSAEYQVNNASNSVISNGESAGKEYEDLQKGHEQGNKKFSEARNAENERQSDWVGDNSMGQNEVNKIKDELQKKINQE